MKTTFPFWRKLKRHHFPLKLNQIIIIQRPCVAKSGVFWLVPFFKNMLKVTFWNWIGHIINYSRWDFIDRIFSKCLGNWRVLMQINSAKKHCLIISSIYITKNSLASLQPLRYFKPPLSEIHSPNFEESRILCQNQFLLKRKVFFKKLINVQFVYQNSQFLV